MGRFNILAGQLLLAVMLPACSAQGPGDVLTSAAGGPPPTIDAATRKEPVVVGRPARVFIFAGVGDKCEPLAEPQVTVTTPPAKGDLSIVHGQETAIAASAQGKCIGAKAKGTGVYYTARKGGAGTDRFSVTARLASGQVSTRSFEVTIVE